MNRFRVRDVDKNTIIDVPLFLDPEFRVCYIDKDTKQVTGIEYDGSIDLELFTGFRDVVDNPIYRHDVLWLPYNKQDRTVTGKDGYTVTVDWDEHHGQWMTYEYVGDTIMKHTPLWKVTRKARLV